MTGTLAGLRVVEIGGLGPAPFAAMMLADHGASVLRVVRPQPAPLVDGTGSEELAAFDVLARNRPTVEVDLKSAAGTAVVHELSDRADVLIEGFRPGVAERLGIGPDDLMRSNPRLIYARMTGWGQDGPLAASAGHDINYISVAGVQAHVGRAGSPPTPPLNLVGDFGGGGMMLAFGICAALVERSRSDRGQTIDAAMVDGAALLMAPLYGASQSGYWDDRAGHNLLDSGAPFYDCYRCADDRFVSVGALEPAFFAALLDGLDLDDSWRERQMDAEDWPELRRQIGERFAGRPRDEWVSHFEGRDACVTPVATMTEAPAHPHLAARESFVKVGDATHPAPAPRFDRSAAPDVSAAQLPGGDLNTALDGWGIGPDRLAEWRSTGAMR